MGIRQFKIIFIFCLISTLVIIFFDFPRKPQITEENKKPFYLINNRKNFNKDERIKVVFFSGNRLEGYGNKLYSMMSAFLVALLTDSVFLINWTNIDKYVESPFLNTFRKFNDSSDLDFSKKEPKIFQLITITENSWKSRKKLILNTSIPSKYTRLFVDYFTPYFFDLCSNPAYFCKLLEYNLVKDRTIQRALNSLNNTTSSDIQRVENLLLIGFEYAGSVLNKYWRLKNTILDRINNFTEKYLKDSFVIGFQLRLEFIKNQRDIELFIKCAQTIENNTHTHVSSFRWFISTDNPNLIENLKNRFGPKILNGLGKVTHVGFDPSGYERALFDLEVLSRCDKLIFSGGSSFGFISAIKSQKIPYYVEGNVNMRECKLFDFKDLPKRPDGPWSVI